MVWPTPAPYPLTPLYFPYSSIIIERVYYSEALWKLCGMNNTPQVDVSPVNSVPPVPLPRIDGIGLGEMGFMAIAAVWLLQTVLKQHTSQVSESWQMLENLVAAQQETNKQLVETNRELILRLGRIHERLERLERLIHDVPRLRLPSGEEDRGEPG